MFSTWAPLQTVLDAGPHYILEDQRIWEAPIGEFGVACRITRPLSAEMDIFPQDDGVLVRGIITGQVACPCSRCAEDAIQDMAHRFDSFEPFPGEDGAPATNRGGNRAKKAGPAPDPDPDPDLDEFVLRWSPKGTGLEINLGALAWEEFASALAARPLCRLDCAGLCAKCGQNLNNGSCACAEEKDDPRLARLRGLTLIKK